MMTTFTDWDILRNLLLAARWTLLLSLTAFVGGTLVTLPLLFLRLLQRKWLTRLIRCYTELFQGTPLLMQLFLAFFGVGLFGIDVAPWTAASLALTFYTSAFLLDIWFGSRAGDQGHRARLDYRLYRTHQSRDHFEQRDLSAFQSIWPGRAGLLPDVLSAVPLQPVSGEKIPCRSSPLIRCRSTTATTTC